MRNCPKRIYMKVLREMECSNGGYTPLLYRPWFMTLLLVVWVVWLMIVSVFIDILIFGVDYILFKKMVRKNKSWLLK